MPNGKPAGVRCIHLTDDLRCALFGKPERPKVCGSLQPMPEMCGDNAAEAMEILTRLEAQTHPDGV